MNQFHDDQSNQGAEAVSRANVINYCKDIDEQMKEKPLQIDSADTYVMISNTI